MVEVNLDSSIIQTTRINTKAEDSGQNRSKLNHISAASQDYLEVILELSKESDKIRSIDIAERLDVSKASVNKAVSVLKTAGFISQEKYYAITLTQAGTEAALAVLERHEVLKNFLTNTLGVTPTTAEADACKMEHSISEETLIKLKTFLSKLEK